MIKNKFLLIAIVIFSISCDNFTERKLADSENNMSEDTIQKGEENSVEEKTISKTEGLLSLIGSNRVKLGELIKGERIIQNYSMVNNGTEPVEILNYRKSCNCTEAEISQLVVQPQDSVDVKLVVETNDKNLGRHKINVTLETNGKRKFYYLEAEFDLIEKS